MAKRATRNLAQLRKDNRTSNKPTRCHVKGCDNESYVHKPKKDGTGTYTRTCAPHFANPPQDKRRDQTIAMLKSYGLL